MMASEDGSWGRGAVVLVPFPFTSQTASKQRPAVIISSDDYNRERPDVIVMAITSQIRPTPAFGEVWLEHWRDAGLLKASAIKPVIATLERGLLIRKLGVLQGDDQRSLNGALEQILGHAPR